MQQYEVGQYTDKTTGKTRWGVMNKRTKIWYFSKQYGKDAAVKRCNRMNKELQPRV